MPPGRGGLALSGSLGLRFAPPRSPPPPALGWLLQAAFGPELPAVVGTPEELPRLAADFNLGPRIVARHGAAALTARLGPAAAGLLAAHRRAVALALAGDRLARRIGALAAGRHLAFLFLKGYALQLVAPGPPGWRPFADLDLLLSPDGAAELSELLVADGWRPSAEAGNPQHLPALVAPQGLAADLHYRLRGVRVAAARWATLDELLAADLCRPAAQPTTGAWLPRPALLAAHLAVHAVEQHGHRPATYPLLRAVADIADLGAAGDSAPLAGAVRPLVCDSLADDELDALFALARILSEGRMPVAGDGAEGGAESLLRHIAAGVLDPVYRRSLAIDHTAGRLRQARADGELVRYIARKLTGPDDAPEAGCAERARRPGAGWRLTRPFRLAARFASAAIARLRSKLDR